MEKAKKVLGWLLSPSRMYFDRKKLESENRTEFHRNWSRNFIYSEITLSVLLTFLSVKFSNLHECAFLFIPLLIVAWSRINEVAYAFYCDAFSHLNNEDPQSQLSMPERARMALRSYIGIIVYFAIIYYFYWTKCKFSIGLENFYDALYFSTITVATVGYGDIYPKDPIIRAFVMYEVLVGLLLVVVAIGTYLGGTRKKGSNTDA